MDYTQIKKWLKENLNEERYIHTLGTADCAKELAAKYNLDSEKHTLQGCYMTVQNVFLTTSFLI